MKYPVMPTLNHIRNFLTSVLCILLFSPDFITITKFDRISERKERLGQHTSDDIPLETIIFPQNFFKSQ